MTRTFKRIVSFFLVLIAASLLFATDDAKRITAFKQNKVNGLPAKSVSIRCLTAVGEEIAQDQSMILSEEFRKNNLSGFSWICSGNAFGQVTVTFTFGPMTNVNSTFTSNNLIYYKVNLTHEKTRIGNSSVANEVTPSVAESLKRVFPEGATTGTRFAIIYADNANVSSGVTVKDTEKEQSVTYDFTTYSRIYKRKTGPSDTIIDSESDDSVYKNAFSSSDASLQNICEFWNRYGTAYIELDVDTKKEGDSYVYYTNGGSMRCEEGWYSADVTIAVVAN